MILYLQYHSLEISSCPHTRGDDPYPDIDYGAIEWLVPTRVGMILSVGCIFSIGLPCPHTRGDDPYQNRN